MTGGLSEVLRAAWYLQQSAGNRHRFVAVYQGRYDYYVIQAWGSKLLQGVSSTKVHPPRWAATNRPNGRRRALGYAMRVIEKLQQQRSEEIVWQLDTPFPDSAAEWFARWGRPLNHHPVWWLYSQGNPLYAAATSTPSTSRKEAVRGPRQVRIGRYTKTLS